MKYEIYETFQGKMVIVATAGTQAVAHIIAQALREAHYHMGDKAPLFHIEETK